MRSSKAKTQKVKGILALQHADLPIPTIHGLIQSDEDVTDFIDRQWKHLPGEAVFARPCPFEPKHGYIDSRVIDAVKELRALWRQVKEDDPNGEILLMQPIDAAYNLLLTPNLMVVGSGHDGATAGKDTVIIPILLQALPSKVYREAELDLATSDPYIEVVVLEEKLQYTFRFTQLRAGPKTDKVIGDFIPHPTTVQYILRADATQFKDREWERAIERAKDLPGLVVWHPGGAITDHFSIHARSFNIPVIYGDKPKIGDTLVPFKPVEVPNPQAVLRGIVIGSSVPLWHGKSSGYGHDGMNTPAIAALLTALHHSAEMVGDTGELIGIGIGLLMRLGCVALMGESRHRSGNGLKFTGSRTEVYKKGYQCSIHRLRCTLPWLINVFRYGEFSSGGVGGEKWAACGKTLIPLFEGTRQLALNPSDENVRFLIRALNVAVNQAHNGGWWLNKFASGELFVSVPKGDLTALSQAGVAFHYCTTWGREHAKLVEAGIEQVKKWGETKLSLPRITGVNMLVRDGISALQFMIQTPFLRGSVKTFMSDTDVLKKLLEATHAEVFLTSDEVGYLQIEARAAGFTSVLWKEKNLDEIAAKSLQENQFQEDEEEDTD